MERWISLFGIFFMLFLAYLFCPHKRRINKKTVLWGMGLQFIFAILVLGVPALGFSGPLRGLFSWANDFVISVLAFTDEGSRFLFGPLMSQEKTGGFIFALQVLPTIIFISSLMSIGYHIGAMQAVTLWIAKIMQKTMGTSGAESLSTAANIFVGQTEAPLVVFPYIPTMTRSELLAIMIGGMATVAGGVLAAYVGLLKARIPDIAGHLLTASILCGPATLVIAKILLPETETPDTMGHIPKFEQLEAANVIEAAARGAGEGLTLALNVATMLLAFIALIAMVNAGFNLLGGWIHFSDWGRNLVPDVMLQNGEAKLSLQLIFGWIFSPIAFVMGIPWSEAVAAGMLLGEKVSMNEFVAYLHLSQISDKLSDRSMVILSYALCGFANFSSIAIQIGGIGGMAPTRKTDLAKLGLLSVLGGSLTTFLTASIAGFLL